MNRLSTAGVCLLVLSACGDAEVSAEASPPVILHELDATPGCYVPPGPTGSCTPQACSSALMTQMHEMNLAFSMQYANLLLQPVLEAPTATEWLVEGFGGSRIEGQSLARGDDWGELVLVLLNGEASLRAEVHYDPHATVIEMNRGSIIQTNNFVRSDDITLGCDPETRWSFRVVDGSTECWDENGEPLVPVTAEPTREEMEMQMSANLQCLALIQRAVRL